MIFTTPDGTTYVVSDELLADGGITLVAEVVAADRDGCADVVVAPHDDDAPPGY